MRLAILLSVLWMACSGKPALSPTEEGTYQAELAAAEESGKTCQEALANIAAVEKRWATKFATFNRPLRTVELHCDK